MPTMRRDQQRGIRSSARTGFTLIEMMIVLAIVATLAVFALPRMRTSVDAARSSRAAQEIRVLEGEVAAFQAGAGRLPPDLATIGRGSMRDPWGRPYQYTNLQAATGVGQARKDKFLVPLNSDFDLYSLGADGATALALTASVSLDDVVRANDGAFVGLASKY